MKPAPQAPEPGLQSLREAVNRLLPATVLMDLSHYPRTVSDPQGVILYANPAFSALTGFPPEETVGLDHRALGSKHHPPFFWSELWHVLVTEKKVWHGEIRNRRKDGSLFWVEAEIIPVLDRGEVAFFLTEMKDISARKQVEAEREGALAMNRRAVENARLLQRQMITEHLPVVPGLDMSALYAPCENLSGDLFMVRWSRGKLAVMVADCTGHGVEASMTANLMWRTLLQFESMLFESVPRVSDFMVAINRRFFESRTEHTGFPTLSVGVLDMERSLLTCARAGGVGPLAFLNRTLRPIEVPPGLMLGVMETASYRAVESPFEKGETLLFMSDGVLEERERKGKRGIFGSKEFFGQMIRGYPDGGHVENIRYLFTQLADVPKVAPLSDDATMILIKVLTDAEREQGRGQRHAHTLFL